MQAHLSISLSCVDESKPCDVCGGRLGDPVSRSMAYMCYLCNRDFKRGDRLVAHASQHTKVKAFFCQHCPRTFSRRSRLGEHEARFHQLDIAEETGSGTSPQHSAPESASPPLSPHATASSNP